MNNEYLLKKILEAANKISVNARYSPANYIIVGSDVANEMQKVLDPEYNRKLREKKLKRIMNK